MPTARFIHDGRSIDYTPTEDVPAGKVVIQGELVGVAKVDIPAHTLGALAVTGVFAMPKSEYSTIEAGVKVYGRDHPTSPTVATTQLQDHVFIGKTVAAADSGELTVLVRLTP